MTEEQNKEQESSFLFFLRLVVLNWKLLLYTYLIVGVVTVIILLVIPKWYKSEATIVILEESASPITRVLSEFSSLGLGFGGATSVDTYIGYLNTHKIYDRLIEEFNLNEVYRSEVREDLYAAIFANLSTMDNENKTFTISYTYKEDPEKAAEIVQFLYEQLDEITLEVDQAQAANFRRYIENYYKEVRSQLRESEDSLSRFQVRTGLLDLESQVQFTIESLINLEQQKVNLEIQRNYIADVSQNEARVREFENQISAIAKKIEDLKNDPSNIILALDKLPENGMNFLRLQRDILVGEKVAEFLRLQYEQALLDEQKINSNLYLIDPPHIPQKKYKPQRTKTLFIVMFITFTLSLIFIRAKEYYTVNHDKLKRLF